MASPARAEDGDENMQCGPPTMPLSLLALAALINGDASGAVGPSDLTDSTTELE